MITDLDETIKQLLIEGVPLDTSEVDVVFEAPTEEWSSSLARPTVNCYLYHTAENHELRQQDWQAVRPAVPQKVPNGDGNGNGNGSGGSHLILKKRAPYRIDCFYMITVWANEPEDEHVLLWRVTSALIRYNNNPLPVEKLKGALAEQDWSVPVKVAQPEAPIKNPTDFWSSMEVPIRPGVQLQVTLPLDPDMERRIPLVLTRRLRTFPIEDYSQVEDIHSVQFGGWVIIRDAAGKMQPVRGARVTIVQRNQSTTTDWEGRYKFDYIPPGHYTLRASSESGQAEREINVPGESYDLEVKAGAAPATAAVAATATAPAQRAGSEPGEDTGREGDKDKPDGHEPEARQSGKGRRR